MGDLKEKIVRIALTEEEMKKLENLAKENRRSVSNFISVFLAEMIEEKEAKTQKQ
jgi:hypothetical protein